MNSCNPLYSAFDRLRSTLLPDAKVPTLVHVTHAKAGSTWVDCILRQLFRRRVAARGFGVAKESGGVLAQHIFKPGEIYSAMFMTREEFLAHPELDGVLRFVVIRDLRDTLVSLYFSLKYSHKIESDQIGCTRTELQRLSVDDGMLYLCERHLKRVAAIQKSWLGVGEVVLKYEDLLSEDEILLKELLIERFKMPVSAAAVSRAVRRCRFETVFKRKLGDTDETSHGRQGLPGDWKRHFSARVQDRFKEMFGDLLEETGYESGRSW